MPPVTAMIIPSATATRFLPFAGGQLQIEACLDKACVSAGEPIVVHLSLANGSNKTVKKLKATLVQSYQLSFAKGQRRMTVNRMECAVGLPVIPGATFNQVASPLVR